jgi:hypothetical protein
VSTNFSCYSEPVSSVGIVIGYKLGDRGSILYPVRPADSGARPASSTMVAGDELWPGRDADHSPPLVQGLRKRGAVPTLAPSAFRGVAGQLNFFLVVTCERTDWRTDVARLIRALLRFVVSNWKLTLSYSGVTHMWNTMFPFIDDALSCVCKGPDGCRLK